MADNVEITPGVGVPVASDEIEIGGKKVQVQRIKPIFGADGAGTDVSAASPLPVDDDATQILLSAIKALLEGMGTVKIIDGGSTIGVDDNGTSLTIDDGGSSITVDFSSLPSGSNNIGDVDVISLPELPAGTKAIGKLAANSGVDIGDVDVLSIASGTNKIGDVGLGTRTSGGLSIFRSLDLDETEEEVKATFGQLYWYHFANLASSLRYLKFYNATAAGVTVGSTPPVMTIPLPKESAGHVPIPQGFAFSTAITVAATTGLADADTGAPGANEVVVNLGYA